MAKYSPADDNAFRRRQQNRSDTIFVHFRIDDVNARTLAGQPSQRLVMIRALALLFVVHTNLLRRAVMTNELIIVTAV